MKNQYVGDIGDYGKYGLLSFLADNGITIGVNWYLTENDESNDGKFTDYLKNDSDSGDKCYNPDIFNLLKKIAGKENKCVQDIEKSRIIPNAVFYHKLLEAADRQTRSPWHREAMKALNDVELVFADPDNGTLNEAKKYYRKNGKKYALIDELREYYDRGQNIVYYCHKARRKDADWQKKYKEFNDDGHDAQIFVLTFHRGTQRSYIFAVHKNDEEKYKKLIMQFLETNWGTKKVEGKKEPFSLE